MNNDVPRIPVPISPPRGNSPNGVDPAGHPLRQLVTGSALGIRPGEKTTAWLFFLYFFLLATIHYIGKTVRDSIYVFSLGATKLPIAYLAVALISFPVIVLYARFTSRASQRFLIITFALIQAAGMAAFSWLFQFKQDWIPVAYYVWAAVAFGIGLSQFWSYANHRFDPRQARRLFAFIGAGGLLGAVPGGQIASLFGRYSETRFALLAAAGLSVALILIVTLLERGRRSEITGPRRHGALEQLRSARGGFQALLSSPLLLSIAALMFIAMFVNQMVDLQFKWVIQENTQGLEGLTLAFGKFYTVMGLLAFSFQILFTQRIHRALGVAVGLRVLPLSIAVSSVLLILAYGPLAVIPVVTAAYILKLSENGFRHSVEQSSRELLFLPVPSPLRLQAKAFIDIFVQRVARGAAAVALLPVAYGVLQSRHISWAILVLVVLWLGLTVVARREYVRAFREGLKAGVMDEMPMVDTSDVNTIKTLVEALGSSDARQVLHSLELLSASGQERLVPPLLLHHEHATVRRKTLGVMASAGRTEAIPLVERAILDNDIEVRSAAIHALAVLKGGDAAEFMLPRLSDPDPRIRAAAVASLATMEDPEVSQKAEEVLNAMVADDDASVRLEAARAVAEIPEPTAAGSIVQLLYDTNQPVVMQAIVAVRKRMEAGQKNPMYVPTLISLMGNRRLRSRVREAVVAYGESAIPPLVLFMNAEEEQIWVRRSVPMTIAQINSPAAATTLIETLDAPDPLVRKNAIQALAYLRTRHPEIRVKGDTVARQIRRDAMTYLRCLSDLWAVSSWHETRFDGPYAHWQAAGRVPTLLQQVLAQRMATAVDNIFGLIKLIHTARDVEATYRSLASGQQALRANALEYLDNTLAGTIRRDVFAVIDDAPTEEKLRQAAQLFGITVESPDETLGRLLEPESEGDPAAVMTFAAIHAVYTEKISKYFPAVIEIARNTDNPILKETSEWVAARLGLPLGEGQPGSRGEDPEAAAEGAESMKKMALIEKVVLLQGVDLFGTCNAEQVLQLASIANEIWFKPDGVIYQHNEPPEALYCIVEGKVDLAPPGGDPFRLGARETFGVLDILRSQLRSKDATAASQTHALVIEAEDFFDLIAINIEIVRALFRQLTDTGSDAPPGLH